MNINKLTWLSYLIFIFLGCVFISQGIIILYLSKTYNINLAYIGYLFFITAAMQATATYTNGFLLEKVNLKIETFIGLAAVFISYLCLISGYLPLFIFGLFPLGLGYGILISIPNYLIVTLHPEKKFQKLNILNFFFSVGGIIGPLVLGQLLDINWHWQIIVLLSCILMILLGVFIYYIPFDKIQPNAQNNDQNAAQAKQRWHISIYLIFGAILFYVVSECVFSTWIVSYLKLKYNFSILNASLSLTIFWLFITFGRFASDKIGRYMKIYQFIICSTLLAFTAYFFLLVFQNPLFIFVMIAIMGIGYAGLYASILSYGIDQLKYNSPQLMSFLVLAGTIGTILALPISSFFVSHFSILSAIFLGFLILGGVVVCVILTLYDKNNIAVEYRKRRLWGAITRRSKIVLIRHIWQRR
ncbi:MAG: MFS transporter [bacterium]|nr:MFS transporter [bacterium]